MIRVILKLVMRGVIDMRQHPWAQMLTLAAVTLVAFLGGLFLLFLHNLNQELLRTQGEVAFQVYWAPGADTAMVEGQWEQMDHLPFLEDKITFTPNQGLESLSESLKVDFDLDWLKGENPIPHTALLTFSPDTDDMDAWVDETLGFLEKLPGVEKVHFNTLRKDLASAWKGFSHNVVWPLIGFLVLVLALVVGNTIKLAHMRHMEEVAILRLVGARNWYIQLPLLVGGAVQGLVGSGVALAMLKVVQLSLEDVLHFPPLNMRIEFLPPLYAAGLAAALTFVGVASSWVATRR